MLDGGSDVVARLGGMIEGNAARIPQQPAGQQHDADENPGRSEDQQPDRRRGFRERLTT
jgi:hypothetical protein